MTDSNVVDLGVEPSRLAVSPPAAPTDDLTRQVMLLARWRKLLAVRWLCFIALLAANGIWLYAVIEPTPWRFGVACAFSILVLVPTYFLYEKRAD